VIDRPGRPNLETFFHRDTRSGVRDAAVRGVPAGKDTSSKHVMSL
jgi:hypothetical protein